MTIRKMAPDDVAAVESILAASPEAAQWTMSQFNEQTWPASWVAEEDGHVIGIVAARTAAGDADILNLAVTPERRKRGVGRLLVETAISAMRALGAVNIYLEVRESNAEARSFYAGMGFAESGRRRDYYREPTEDALVLHRKY